MRTEKKQKLKQLRRWRIRKKVTGTKLRPRMAVCFTSENIHVQFIDDVAGKTLAAASTVSKGETKELSANVAGAKKIGAIAAANAQLAVPVIAALAGVVLFNEPITTRLVLSSILVLGGSAVAVRRSVATRAV